MTDYQSHFEKSITKFLSNIIYVTVVTDVTDLSINYISLLYITLALFIDHAVFRSQGFLNSILNFN